MWQDVSRPLEAGMEVYPGDRGFALERVRRVEADGYQLSEFAMSAHCGTHFDAPAHFVPGGGAMESVDASLFFGPALLVRAKAAEDLRRIPFGARRVVLADDGFGGVSPSDAEFLVGAGVKMIGTDRLSVSDANTALVHRRLLGAGILLLEGLLLSDLPEGEYELVALPLRLMGAEGAPARAFVRAL